MKLSTRLLFALVLPLAPAMGAEVELDPAKAWFKPVLVENRSALCPAVLAEANRLFYTRAPRLGDVPIVLEGMEAMDASQPQSVTTHGRKIYLAMRTIPGCGSACEGRQMFASANPFEIPMRADEPPGLSKPTPAAPELTLQKSQDDLYHVVVIVNEQLQLYTLTADATWDSICKVDVQPRDIASRSDNELRAALQSVHDLQATISPLRQEAGDCGSLKAHDRGHRYMRDAFQRALYRPWTLQASSGVPADSLAGWSVVGIDEYASLAKFRAQLPVTIDQLTRFYTHRFGWSQKDAAIAAENAVAGAVADSFAFSSVSLFSDGSVPVRRAILENRPVAELEALNWQPKKSEWPSWAELDSPLNIAVNHPAALRWLLSKQLDPNQTNVFGKTPLMYAAQHNALEAVRILLEHGADPNAATIFPDDTCTYTLWRANVTALHYAVRYGSTEIVQALLDGGALPFVRTDERIERQPGRAPLDWLEMYASPNIADADRPRLKQLLRPFDGRQLSEYAQQQTLQAEKQYAAGDLMAARRSLKNALQASPSDARALSNMSLVALRTGQYGESLEAATRLILGSADARLRANAWFNIGLACERSGQSYLSYNGDTYCMSSSIFPFLQSWRAASSRARVEKLEQLFAASGKERCVVPQPDSTEHRYIFVRAADMEKNRYAEIQRVYVLHPTGSEVSAAKIRWNVTPYAGAVRSPQPVTPRLVGSYELGSSTLTVFEADAGVQSPVKIGDYQCF
jgi:tetratricopeptide (TPR) repeat protein